MSNPLDLTGQNISDTYERIVQTDGGYFYDGLGNTVSVGGIGFQGVQGSTGPSGGPPGDRGFQGFQGPTGDSGAVGSQGPQGSQGPRGDLGTSGVQGVQGFQGLQGIQGPQGVQGPEGFQGVQGSQGIQGIQGIQGWQGAQGAQGVEGTQGPQGPQGFQGPQGTQGFVGFQGVQGSQGRQGFQGPQGRQGVQGGLGPTGADALYVGTSKTNVAVPSVGATVTLVVTQGLSYTPNQTAVVTPVAASANFFSGLVTSYSAGSGAMTILCQALGGATGTSYNDWLINLNSIGVQGAQGRQGAQGIAGEYAAIGLQGFQGFQGPQGTPGVTGAGFQGPEGWQGSQGPVGFSLDPELYSGDASATLAAADTPENIFWTQINSNSYGFIGLTYNDPADSFTNDGESTLFFNVSGYIFWNPPAGSGGYRELILYKNGTDILAYTRFDSKDDERQSMTYSVNILLDPTDYFVVVVQAGVVRDYSAYISIAGLFTGPQGIQGVQGWQGDAGPTGAGEQGAQGFQGPQGWQGDLGPTGAGAQGPQGFQGVTGPAGSGAQRFTGSLSIDFGFTGGGEDSYTTTYVTDANVTNDSSIFFRGVTSSNHESLDDFSLENISILVGDISAGVGFTAQAYAANGSWGIYSYNYTIINYL